ncbi:hypothetical protein BGX27_006263 [Mortierella sp. AM989]|nr:hypothetical protein BGX27_006263 [Mortierella sp. AM989]
MTATKPSSTSNIKSPSTPQTKNVFRLHGVNVLNRKNIDSIARLTALERRRTTHILDERQRRDTMNQLLTELSSLIRESASEVDPQQQQQQQLASVPTLNTDGRPPVKSNSITTLRNAIAEIQRLRACAGLQDSNSTNQTPAPSRRSSTRSTSPSLSEFSSLSTLAELATQHHSSEFDSNSGSGSSSLMSSPRLTSSRALSPAESLGVTPDTKSAQLNSPPLSPSDISSLSGFSSTFPPISTMHGTHSQAPILPPLHAIVESACSTSQHIMFDTHQYEHQSSTPQGSKNPVLSENLDTQAHSP